MPVRINNCGHYFCSSCISHWDKICPKCKVVFLPEDITSDHRFDKAHQEILFFKRALEPLFHCISNQGGVRVDQTIFPFRIKFADPKSLKYIETGENQLHVACKRNKLVAVKKLIADNVDINLKDYACWTPLHEAIQVESIEIVQELLKSGALINAPGKRYVTPLHKAVLVENSEIIRILIENGADIEAIDYAGRKPEDCTTRQDLLQCLHNTTPKQVIEKPCIFLGIEMFVHLCSIDESFKQLFKSMKNVTVCDYFDLKKQKLTHLIVKKSHKISTKILISMLAGLIIIRQEWVEGFSQGLVNIPPVPVLQCDQRLSSGIKRAMKNHMLNKPKLLDGISFFIESFYGENKMLNDLPISENFLVSLISAGGGVILPSAPAPRRLGEINEFPYHASQNSSVYGCSFIILFDDRNPPKHLYKRRELQHKSDKWLIDCVINFKLI